jgi:hypothetical protein
MSDTPTIQWPGQSGRSYKYWIYPIGHSLKAEGGNYIFAKETKPNSFTPVYIGQTGDLDLRFDDHHKAPCVYANGATHIHAHFNANEDDRLAEEADLIAKWDPPCNG